MNQHVKRLAEEMRRLAPADRAELIDELLIGLQSASGDWDQAWGSVADRRWAELQRGESASYEAEDVLNDIGERLRRRRNR